MLEFKDFFMQNYEAIAKLILTPQEVQMLGIMQVYKKPDKSHGINGYDWPYQFIQEVGGSFALIRMFEALVKKLGDYENNVVLYLKHHATDSFDIHKISYDDLFAYFSPFTEELLQGIINGINSDGTITFRFETEEDYGYDEFYGYHAARHEQLCLCLLTPIGNSLNNLTPQGERIVQWYQEEKRKK